MALGGVSAWRHAVVGVVGLGAAGLAYLGVIGGGDHPERFDAKQILVTPAGGDGLSIREVVDQDFGSNARHGFERTIPNDFGVPTDVIASSPDAPDDLSVVALSGDLTRIRIGDPDTTIDGQHRYELSYTLPDALVTTGQLALDIIGTDETLETETMEIVVSGLELSDPRCSVGTAGTSGGCTLERDGEVYRAVISPLEPGQGVTIGGVITAVGQPADVPVPPIPERRDDNSSALALAMLPAVAVTGGGVYAWARRKGRNEVGGAGAADAAFGGAASLAPPLPGTAIPGGPIPAASVAFDRTPGTRLVTDAELATLATTEFVPPRGIAPWQGAVLLDERLDDSTVQAWFGGMVALGYLDLRREGDEATMLAGPKYDAAPPAERAILDKALGSTRQVELGTYHEEFAGAWRDVRGLQADQIGSSGWWRGSGPGAGGDTQSFIRLGIFAIVALLVLGGSIASAAVGMISSPIAAVLFGAVLTGVTALVMYRKLLPSRTAAGSALALRTESFRRFLAASEGRHVEWAWNNGLLREYSAWAVALGAAGAWERAMEASGIPREEYSSGPILMYSVASTISRTTTAPSSTGGSGGGFSGGGFSGGSVGGGGGGGSSGSW